MDTVKLEGKYFNPKVKVCDIVKKGELLLEFDIEKIKELGYTVTTPVIVSNFNEFENFSISNLEKVEIGREIMTL